MLDTTADEDGRVRAYIDGVDQGIGSASDPPTTLGETIDITSGQYVLGNRQSDNRTPEGNLYYCALYSVALTPDEVSHNAQVLLADDDTPP